MGRCMDVAVIVLIITLGEWGGLTDDQYLVNILTVLVCVLTALGFVVAATCGTWRYCRDDGVVVERIFD